MSENRFKVSKASNDGAENTKETYRRVNLSTDIEVNIIEPCKWSWNRPRPRALKISYIFCHTPLVQGFFFWQPVLFMWSLLFFFFSKQHFRRTLTNVYFIQSCCFLSRVRKVYILHLLLTAPERKANKKSSLLTGKAGNLALYEVKIVFFLQMCRIYLFLRSLLFSRRVCTVHFKHFVWSIVFLHTGWNP